MLYSLETIWYAINFILLGSNSWFVKTVQFLFRQFSFIKASSNFYRSGNYFSYKLIQSYSNLLYFGDISFCWRMELAIYFLKSNLKVNILNSGIYHTGWTTIIIIINLSATSNLRGYKFLLDVPKAIILFFSNLWV